MSQCNTILAHLKRHGEITPLEALRMFGVMRLAARIETLRAEGHHIETRMVERKGKRFASYRYYSRRDAA